MTILNLQGSILFETLDLKKHATSQEMISQDFLSLLKNKENLNLGLTRDSQVLNSYSLDLQSSEFLNILESLHDKSENQENPLVNLSDLLEGGTVGVDLSKTEESYDLILSKTEEVIDIELPIVEDVIDINLIEFKAMLDVVTGPEISSLILIDNQSEILIDLYSGDKLNSQNDIEQFIFQPTNLVESSNQLLVNEIYLQPIKNDFYEFSTHSNHFVSIVAPLSSVALGVESQSYSFLDVNPNLHTGNNNLKLGTIFENLKVYKSEPLSDLIKSTRNNLNNHHSFIVSKPALSKNIQAKGESIIRNNLNFSALFDNRWLEQNITIVREKSSVELWVRDFKSSKSRLDHLVSNLLSQLNNSTVRKVIVNGEVVINIKELNNAG